MSGRPLVSVVTGFYNRLDGVVPTMDSLLAQECADLEILAFDDRSTDGTREKLESYRDPRLRLLLHGRNVGFTQGMIDAVAAARGDYIAVHGAGDASLPGRFAVQRKRLDERPDLVLVAVSSRESAGGGESDGPLRSAGEVAPAQLRATRLPFTHGSVMYRKSAYAACGGYRREFRFCQDRDLWLRMRRLGGMEVLPQILYERTLRSDGASFSPRSVVQQIQFQVLTARLASCPEAAAAALLGRVAAGGVDAVVPIADHEVQRHLQVKAIVLASHGWWPAAESVAGRLADAGGPRHPLSLMLKAYIGSAPRMDRLGRIASAARALLGAVRGR